MNIRLYNIGEKVELVYFGGQFTGTVCGPGVFTYQNIDRGDIPKGYQTPTLQFPVLLDKPFWSNDGIFHVSVLLVHHDNLKPLEEEKP